ncbi:MAG: hypothetical protein DMF21_07005 [Verrucomicrobia bacterium]|nr:MAG: hypothetical protein DMF09_10540 [Verrucomicrobiota bacterium]PYL80969.1 MAG: hypothetical protein DMF21_07005 [Verrucomicrobiota bacterium]
MMRQVGDYVPEFCQTPLYSCRIGEASADTPPNPGHAIGKRQLIFQSGNHARILVSVQKVKRERQPLPRRNYANEVQQEHEQIVSLP